MNRPELALPRPRRRNQLGQAMGAKGARTRRKLLEATETLLNTTPLRDLGVAQIVRVANTSAATFYVYFNDVSEAVLALIGELTQSPPNLLALVADPWEGGSALDHAHEFVAAYSDKWQSHAAAFRVRNVTSDEGDLRFTELRINAVSPLINVMARRIEGRRAAGGLPADLDPASAAGALLAMIERIAGLQLAGRNGVTRPRLLHVAAFFSVLLLGDGWRRTPVATEPVQAPNRVLLDTERSTNQSVGSPTVNLHGQAMGAKGARTRQRLVDATAELLRTTSLLGMSVAEIAKFAKTSTSTFYLYFQDVSEALLAAVSEVSQTTPELVALLDGDWDDGEADRRAYEFVAQYIERWQANRGLLRARNLAADEGDARFIRARSESVWPLLELIARRVAQCQAEGRLTGELHPVSAAGGFLAMIERLSVTPNINTGGITTTSVTGAVAYFLAVLMAGVPASAASRPA